MEEEIKDNKLLLVDNQYFTLISCIKYLFSHSNVKIFGYEPYQKMSFRNRCIVAGSNGLVNLSVPLEKGRDQKLPYRDVRVSYREAWQKHQWTTLTSCYNKSAYFEFYRDGVEQFFLKKEVFLFDLNLNILTWLKRVLNFPAEIDVVDTPGFLDPGIDLVDLRNKWLPKNFQDGFLGKPGLPPSLDFLPKYFQVFENRIGFQPNLSILDLLFNEGPNASALLKTVSLP